MTYDTNNIMRKKPIFWSFQFLLLCLILLMGHSQGMIALFTLFCLLFIPKIKRMDNVSVLLLLFSIFYGILSYFNGAFSGTSLLINGLPWFIFYNYGIYLMNESQSERDLIRLLVIVAFCVGLPVYFSVVQRIITTGSLVDLSRVFYFANNEDEKIAGTIICVAIYMGYIGLPAFFLLSKWKPERWLFLLLFVLSILVPISVVTRFPIVVSAMCFLLILYLKYKGNTLRLIGIFLLVVGIVFLLYYQGGEVGHVFEAYSERNDDLENVTTLSSRTMIWTHALGSLLYYPFGWYGTDNQFSFMHNMWLDIARYSGIIPFLLLSAVTIKSFITNVKILKYSKTSLAYIFLALNFCFCMVAFVEPVYGSLTVAIGCMVWGMQEAYLNKLKTNRT